MADNDARIEAAADVLAVDHVITIVTIVVYAIEADEIVALSTVIVVFSTKLSVLFFVLSPPS